MIKPEEIYPYLPYGLKSITYRDGRELITEIKTYSVSGYINGDTSYKPIFKPLDWFFNDDLSLHGLAEYAYKTEPDAFDGLGNAKDWAKVIGTQRVLMLPYEVVTYLLIHHVDIFGHLDAGNGVSYFDVNTFKITIS